MVQLSLIEAPKAPTFNGIDIRNCRVEDLLGEWAHDPPTLVVADPPWSYSQAPGVASPDLQYATTTDIQIAMVLGSAYAVAATRARMAVWCTWPKLMEFAGPSGSIASQEVPIAHPGWMWRYVSGGSWSKLGPPGVGYHWVGKSEPVLLYVKGSGLVRNKSFLENAYTDHFGSFQAWESHRTTHSEKPLEWMVKWIERWTEDGDLVLDLYAGLAPLARACLATGRRYIGAEIDPIRHREARQRLARFAGDRGL